MPIIDLMSASNAHFKKLKDFITLQIPAGFPIKIGIVKPVLSNHIKQDIFLAFHTGGCLLLHESSAESSCRSFLRYFHAAINNHLSMLISMSPERVVAYNRFNCI